MKLERSEFLSAGPYERSAERQGYANGFKSKCVKTRIGELEVAVPKVRGLEDGSQSFYPNALERGLRSERATASLTVDAPKPASKPKRPHHRYLMAQLMRRVFGLEVLRCPVCRRQRTLMSVIMDRTVIVRILSHLGLECDPPTVQPARAPPQSEFAF